MPRKIGDRDKKKRQRRINRLALEFNTTPKIIENYQRDKNALRNDTSKKAIDQYHTFISKYRNNVLSADNMEYQGNRAVAGLAGGAALGLASNHVYSKLRGSPKTSLLGLSVGLAGGIVGQKGTVEAVRYLRRKQNAKKNRR